MLKLTSTGSFLKISKFYDNQHLNKNVSLTKVLLDWH